MGCKPVYASRFAEAVWRSFAVTWADVVDGPIPIVFAFKDKHVAVHGELKRRPFFAKVGESVRSVFKLDFDVERICGVTPPKRTDSWSATTRLISPGPP